MLADTFSQVTSLARITIWPIVVVVVLVVYRHELAEFFARMGGRVSSVSFGGASVEFTPATEAPSTMVSAVTEFIDATSAAGGIASDSGSSLQTAIYSTGADFVKIDLRGGHGWLTSRLYIFSVILSETAGVKRLVFVQRDASGSETFAGMANPLVVAERLGSRFRWLSYALADAESPQGYEQQFPDTRELVRPFSDPQWVSQVAERYLTNSLIRAMPYATAGGQADEFTYSDGDPPAVNQPPVFLPAYNIIPPVHQMPSINGVTPAAGPRAGGTLVTITGQGFSAAKEVRFGNLPAAMSVVTDAQIVALSPPGDGTVKLTVVTPAGSTSPDDWVMIRSSNGLLHAEHALWIQNKEHLVSLMEDAINTASLIETSSMKRDYLREQILREHDDFVAIVDQDDQFRRLVDRRAILERLAKDVAESGT